MVKTFSRVMKNAVGYCPRTVTQATVDEAPFKKVSRRKAVYLSKVPDDNKEVSVFIFVF